MCVFVAILWLRSNAVMGLVVSECDFPNLLPLTIALPITSLSLSLSLSLPLFPLSLFHPLLSVPLMDAYLEEFQVLANGLCIPTIFAS